MLKILLVVLALVTVSMSPMAYSTQTIVFIRHGEKPNNDSGQLSCKGLSRSLALPQILLAKYGTPDAIYASAPKQNKLGNSLRSLQTISPTAIQVSLPINLKYHAKDTKELQKALLNENNQNSTIFVVWEHDNLVKVAKKIFEHEGGMPDIIPEWKSSDFDSIYVLKIERGDLDTRVDFILDKQDLNHVNSFCPN